MSTTQQLKKNNHTHLANVVERPEELVGPGVAKFDTHGQQPNQLTPLLEGGKRHGRAREEQSPGLLTGSTWTGSLHGAARAVSYGQAAVMVARAGVVAGAHADRWFTSAREARATSAAPWPRPALSGYPTATRLAHPAPRTGKRGRGGDDEGGGLRCVEEEGQRVCVCVYVCV